MIVAAYATSILVLLWTARQAALRTGVPLSDQHPLALRVAGLIAGMLAVGGVLGLLSLRNEPEHSLAEASIGWLVFSFMVGGGAAFALGALLPSRIGYVARLVGSLMVVGALAVPSTLTLVLPLGVGLYVLAQASAPGESEPHRGDVKIVGAARSERLPRP